MAKNKVIAGDYTGKEIGGGGILSAYIILGTFKKPFDLTNENIESYEVVTDEHRKSASSGIARGLAGGFLLGPVGLIAGGISAKTKGTYQIAIQFKDGKRSLVEVSDKIYKAIVRDCF